MSELALTSINTPSTVVADPVSEPAVTRPGSTDDDKGAQLVISEKGTLEVTVPISSAIQTEEGFNEEETAVLHPEDKPTPEGALSIKGDVRLEDISIFNLGLKHSFKLGGAEPGWSFNPNVGFNFNDHRFGKKKHEYDFIAKVGPTWSSTSFFTPPDVALTAALEVQRDNYSDDPIFSLSNDMSFSREEDKLVLSAMEWNGIINLPIEDLILLQLTGSLSPEKGDAGWSSVSTPWSLGGKGRIELPVAKRPDEKPTGLTSATVEASGKYSQDADSTVDNNPEGLFFDVGDYAWDFDYRTLELGTAVYLSWLDPKTYDILLDPEQRSNFEAHINWKRKDGSGLGPEGYTNLETGEFLRSDLCNTGGDISSEECLLAEDAARMLTYRSDEVTLDLKVSPKMYQLLPGVFKGDIWKYFNPYASVSVGAQTQTLVGAGYDKRLEVRPIIAIMTGFNMVIGNGTIQLARPEVPGSSL